jgi:hypothetical protein
LLPGLRVAYLAAAVLLLLLAPINESSELLALFVAVDLAAAALFLSKLEPKQRSIVAIGDNSSLPLLRRTLPQLRGRRPAAIIEAQVSWRQAAEFRRQRRELTQRISL